VSFDAFLRVLSASSLADERDADDLGLALAVFRDAHCVMGDKKDGGKDGGRTLPAIVFSEFMVRL
jgi:hypothetical protein